MIVDESIRRAFLKRWEQLDLERNNGWLEAWKLITSHIAPNNGRYSSTDRNKSGGMKNKLIINNTPRLASQTLRNGMYSGLTSKSSKWFRLSVSRTDLLEDLEVTAWMYEVEKIIQEVLAKSNFYGSMYNLLGEAADFGTAVMLVVPDFDDVLRCYNYTIGQYVLGNDERLNATTVYRELQMSANQLVSRFGYDNCSSSVKSSYDNNTVDIYFDVVHAIEPNDDRLDLKYIKEFAYRDVYFEKCSPENSLLAVSGWDEQPHIVVRWDVTDQDIYGWGIGMDVLGDCKELQYLEKEKMYNIELNNRPPMSATHDMKGRPMSTRPNAITYENPVTTTGKSFSPLFPFNYTADKIKEDIFTVERRINEAYFTDLFKMLSNTDRRQITAREIDERSWEKLQQLGSVIERLQESFDVFFNRCFGICYRAGILPQIPDVLEGQQIKIDYISVLAQAQKAVGITAIEQLAGFVGNLAAVNPDILDKFNFDQSMDEYAQRIGVPPTLINSDDQVSAVRQQRAQQQQQQQALQMANMAAQGAKTLSETNTGENNALEAMLGVGG